MRKEKKAFPGGKVKVNRSGRSSSRSIKAAKSQHIPKLNDVHPELRAMVNGFLRGKGIPLKVHTMHFAEKVGDDSKCCLIDGQIVCGPQCF